MTIVILKDRIIHFTRSCLAFVLKYSVMPGLNYHLIKVLNIENRVIYTKSSDFGKLPSGGNYEKTPCKKIEVLEELGWWMKHYYVNVFQNHAPYEDLAVGDKLHLRVS